MPGRYAHNPDPHLAELLHRVTAEGWGNDSVGDLDQDGFHASLLTVKPAEQQELSEAFDRAIPAGNWIVTEDQHGFVVVPAWAAIDEGSRQRPWQQPGEPIRVRPQQLDHARGQASRGAIDLRGAGLPASETQADQQVVVVAGRHHGEAQGREQRCVTAANPRIRIERLQQRWTGPGKILGGQPEAKLVASAVGVGHLAQVADQVVQFRLARRVAQL